MPCSLMRSWSGRRGPGRHDGGWLVVPAGHELAKWPGSPQLKQVSKFMFDLARADLYLS